MESPRAIVVGVLASSAEAREMIRIQISTTGLAQVEVEADQYPANSGDRAVRRFSEVRPDIILVDMEHPQAALQALHVLHAALPETWLFISSSNSDPQLIIETMRAGAREFLPKPIPPRNLSQALGRYIAEKQRRQRNVGKIYCVTAAKGGVGATQVAINLATQIAAAPGTSVSLIDFSLPMGDIAPSLNLKAQFTLLDALGSAARMDSVLLQSYMTLTNGVSVLPGPREFQESQMPGGDALARFLEVVAQTYSQTFVDLASTLDPEYVRLIAGLAARVVVVSTPELPALWRTERLLRFFSSAGLGDKLRLVINRSRKRDEVTDAEISRALKHTPYWRLPNSYARSIDAINTGSPVVSSNHSDLARSYSELAHLLTEVPREEKRRGLFGLFG
jgi:pilus assembly protein CpaE